MCWAAFHQSSFRRQENEVDERPATWSPPPKKSGLRGPSHSVPCKVGAKGGAFVLAGLCDHWIRSAREGGLASENPNRLHAWLHTMWRTTRSCRRLNCATKSGCQVSFPGAKTSCQSFKELQNTMRRRDSYWCARSVRSGLNNMRHRLIADVKLILARVREGPVGAHAKASCLGSV